MKDRRPTLCIVNVSLRGGATGQLESPLTKQELIALFEKSQSEWIFTDGSNGQEEVASIRVGICRADIIQWAIIEKNKSPIKLVDPSIVPRDIPNLREQ